MNYDFKKLYLEAQMPTIGPDFGTIFNDCKKIAAWTGAYKDEIKSLVKKGWSSAQKIVEYLKKKYHKT